MDASNPFAVLVNAAIMVKLTLMPVALQVIKGALVKWGIVKGDLAGPFAAVVSAVTVVTLLPVALQVVKGALVKWGIVKGNLAGPFAAVVSAVTVVTLVVWGGIEAHMAPLTIAGQTVLAWFYTELLYTKVVEPASKSTNPILPDA